MNDDWFMLPAVLLFLVLAACLGGVIGNITAYSAVADDCSKLGGFHIRGQIYNCDLKAGK